jgi:hypothetical protein
MKEGEMLAFSVGGLPLEEKQVCDENKCWNQISRFYLAEVSSCSMGINAESKGFVMKLSKDTQIYYSSVDNNSNSYISETVKTDLDDVELSINDSEPVINSDKGGELDVKSEQKEENTLTDQDVIEEPECECPEEEEETVEKEIPETPEVEEKEEEPVVEKEIETVESDEPIREDYESYEEFAKAVQEYADNLKAKKPATEKQLDELRKEVAELKKALEEKTSEDVITEVVRKSRRVKQPDTDDFEIDLDAKLALVTKSQRPRSKLQ